MLEKKIKGIYLSLQNEKVSDDFICKLLVNEDEDEVRNIINKLLTNKYIIYAS
jgi:hypothetical protein